MFLYIFKNLYKKDELFKYDTKKLNLEKCISLNIPCVNYPVTIWEIQKISGINIKQAKEIKKILGYNLNNKSDFKKELLKIKGIGKKKSNNISRLFFY